MLGRVGPVLIPLTVIMWAGLVVLGFALLQRRPRPHHRQLPARRIGGGL
ncbi:MAG TPA: hypothetical protein VHG51_17985 [Longimicrobiaceae bacterium]|nr:hypothetical protein [Longimicrobiaceae bacterium]